VSPDGCVPYLTSLDRVGDKPTDYPTYTNRQPGNQLALQPTKINIARKKMRGAGRSRPFTRSPNIIDQHTIEIRRATLLPHTGSTNPPPSTRLDNVVGLPLIAAQLGHSTAMYTHFGLEPYPIFDCNDPLSTSGNHVRRYLLRLNY
jgi:hypothetical protein